MEVIHLPTITGYLYPLVATGTAIGVVYMAIRYHISNEQREVINLLQAKYNITKDDKDNLEKENKNLRTLLDYEKARSTHHLDLLTQDTHTAFSVRDPELNTQVMQ